nr:DUF934 domain-containing protein [Acuticoccus mangrovi]
MLETDGSFTRDDDIATGLEIPGEAPPAERPADPVVTIRFGGAMDGRGFSTANRLRAEGYDGRLIAAGPLMPDQARHAFQSGFDAVLVSDAQVQRQGEDAWRNAIHRSVQELYMPEPGSRGPERGIWAARHAD